MPSQRLDAAYNAQIKAIRTRLDAFAAARFMSGQYRDADMARFLKEVVPVVLASRRQVSALTDSYLSQVMTSQLGKRVAPRGPIDTNTLRGVDAKEVYTRPFVTVRTKLSTGMPFDAAVSAGSARLTDILLTDMQMAKTQTAQNVISNSGPQIIGYERTLSGNKSCALCVVASTQMYHKGDLMPIHPGCDCGVQPITRSRPFDSEAATQRLEDTHQSVFNLLGTKDSSARAPDYRKLIATHEHGEIGPVLSIKGQKFTGPSVINK